MKRITFFRNGSDVDGKLVAVTHSTTLQDVLLDARNKLGIDAQVIYTPQGAILDDVLLIRDEDVFYISAGEPFRKPSSTTASEPATDITKKFIKGHERKMSSGTTSACHSSEWVTLNVGGKIFTTTRSTLTQQDSTSMLARMFGDEKTVTWHSSVDESGAYLIDRSPRYFEPILNYLRHGQLVLDKDINPQGVLEEARFFGLTSLMDSLEEIIEKNQVPDDRTPITRRELVLRLLSTPTNKELRCQGMNFTGANLSKLDLRYINFKYAILKNANLAGANLSYCNFERADLNKTILDSANLLGVKMLCANLEGASLRGCNFEDPAGSRANLEGALMKNVNLEGSQLAGVNLRVATLKNANLQNCDLRGAVLAGADLENCDLSGCDLQEANLRGANLKGAAFELMLNPLHMAQAVR
ncbi:BTB/POZ domain-containing protein KCTD9-like isoform X1 [Pecten maximus]|uniref:BTB/POZ domain-containing protein KCTD9-like isoform X1 n=1 Tax=Pecten maximus TaxID=6579 RepID=UPI001458F11B|nr:BTB/POZ domain-containing protein KCTD9-like isoform X1 [Pecten maximus]